MEVPSVCTIQKLLLFGGGFALGTVFSILIMDYIYKGQLKRALDEVHRQYSRAIDLMRLKGDIK